MRRTVLLAGVLFVMCGAPALAQSGPAPGAPGAEALWTQADKDGFGTATSTKSKVWHTLDDGELTEVYYPDLGTPAVRDLQFIVSDGRSFAVRETDATTHRTELLDRRSLTYRQVNTDREGRFRITKTYVTDPTRNALLVDVRFESLTRRPLQLYVLHDPALSNDGGDDSGSVAGSALVVNDQHAGGALAASPRFTQVSNGYLGASDGWEDLRTDFRMDASYASAPAGNVVQTARTSLTGRRHHRTMTLALGFGADAPAALGAARGALRRGFWPVAARYMHGWRDYLRSLRPAPRSARAFTNHLRRVGDVARRTRGQDVPGRLRRLAVDAVGVGPGAGEPLCRLPPRVVARPLPDRHGAAGCRRPRRRASARSTTCSSASRSPTARSRRTRSSTARRSGRICRWTRSRCRSCSPGSSAPVPSSTPRVKQAADFVAANGPFSPQERWENQDGYSPATIAAEIAGLICAADLAERNGDPASAAGWRETADEWEENVEGWTATPTARSRTRRTTCG